MDKRASDKKQPEENIEFVKEEHHPKRNYIFQNSGITKTGFIIIVVFLVLIILGLITSGVFFGESTTNP